MATKKKDKSKSTKSRARGIRPFWSGTLSFGLVSVPVNLFPAHRSGKVRMRMLAPDGTPLSRRYYCPEEGRDIHPEHLIRGFQLESGDYVVVHDDELEELEPKKSREIDLRQFVRLEDIPPLYFERSYFLTPAGNSNKAYRLLAQVMEGMSLAGIATFVMRDKEYLVAILSENQILSAQTLRLEDEIRWPQDVGLPDPSRANSEQVKRFAKAIEAASQKDLSGADLADHYAEQVMKLVERKSKSRKDVIQVETEGDDRAENDDGQPSIDLLETIRRSLGSTEDAAGKDSENGHSRVAGNGADDLSRFSKHQLYQKAQELDVEGRSSMTKEQLLKAVRGRK